MSMDGVIAGRIVHYVLTARDASLIYEKRNAENITGNGVFEAIHVPAMIVAVTPHLFGEGEHGVNLKCFLDGDDSYWITSRKHDEGKSAGSWHWMEKA